MKASSSAVQVRCPDQISHGGLLLGAGLECGQCLSCEREHGVVDRRRTTHRGANQRVAVHPRVRSAHPPHWPFPSCRPRDAMTLPGIVCLPSSTVMPPGRHRDGYGARVDDGSWVRAGALWQTGRRGHGRPTRRGDPWSGMGGCRTRDAMWRSGGPSIQTASEHEASSIR
jgi:hypothetical protein